MATLRNYIKDIELLLALKQKELNKPLSDYEPLVSLPPEPEKKPLLDASSPVSTEANMQSYFIIILFLMLVVGLIILMKPMFALIPKEGLFHGFVSMTSFFSLLIVGTFAIVVLSGWLWNRPLQKPIPTPKEKGIARYIEESSRIESKISHSTPEGRAEIERELSEARTRIVNEILLETRGRQYLVQSKALELKHAADEPIKSEIRRLEEQIIAARKKEAGLLALSVEQRGRSMIA